MTTTLERPPVAEQTPPVAAEPGRHATPRRRDTAWLAPLLLLTGVVHAWGMARAPERIDDEGTYTAQAYAVEYFHQLAHYTYWYDHPPLGWLQISLWTWLTDAFERVTPAVAAGREAMLVAELVSVVLLWALARRVGLSRPAAAGAVLVFALSPLALTFHRMVYLDNVATPWLLAAFLLASARRHQLRAFSASALCFVVMVLTKETTLLLLPVWAWWIWRHADRTSRRYTLTVAGSLLVVCGLGYAVYATLKGELVPGPHHVSLVDGIRFQLLDRPSSGSVLDRNSQAFATVKIWLGFDWVLPLAATVAAVVLLPVRRVRPLAVAYLLLLVLLLRPGYLPIPYVIAMLPFAALLVAAAVDEGVRRRGPLRLLALAAGVTAVALAVPVWLPGLRALTTQDMDRPLQQAQAWITQHVPRQDRMLVDDSLWVDLVRAGYPRDDVVWYYKADTDPAVMRLTPQGWQDYDYLMVTESVRQSITLNHDSGEHGPYPAVSAAYRHSRVVATFGSGNQRVDIRRIEHGGRPS